MNYPAPELLSPAGTVRNMRYAFAYGADAIYAGQPRYSLRTRNNDFSLENLEGGIAYAHKLGKRFYLASNIAPHNAKVRTYIDHMEPVIAMKPDALIMSDPGLIMMVRERWPEQAIHLSVQANVVNFASVLFWAKQGIERIILSRELSLDEIEQIRNECPNMELEVFVHGSLCIAYSGRCLLSGYMNHRDPNQGTCTNACRWNYQAHDATETASGDIVPTQPISEPTLGEGTHTDQVVLLQESTRPNDYMPAFEDEHGTYIMNSKDLRAVQHVPKLTQMGVHSLKIEGRTKSYYYVARTAQVYRQAIDDAACGKDFNIQHMDTLENLASRGYTEGFYRRHVHDKYQNYLRGNSFGTQQQFVGDIIEASNNQLLINVKNRFELGDSMELMTPYGNHNFRLESLENTQGEAVSAAPGSGHQVRIPIPEHAQIDEFTLLMRDLPTPTVHTA